MAENEVERRIIVSVDKQAADAALKSVGTLEKSVNSLGTSAERLGSRLLTASKGMTVASRTNKDLASSVNQSDKALDNQVTSVRSATDAIAEYENRLKSVQASGTDLSGDIASSVGGIRGALGAFGGTGASPALDIVEGLADIGEFAPRLKVQLLSVGDAMRASSGAASTAVSSIGSVVGSVTGLGASLGTVLTVAVPLAAAIGGVALAINYFNTEAQKQAQLLQTTLDAQRSVNEAVATGLTTVDAEARLAELQRLRDAEAQFLQEQKTAYDTALGSLGALGALAQQIAPQEQVLADSINASRQSIAAYDAEINALNQQIENGSLAANDAAVAEAELAQTREQESQRAIQAAEQANQRIAALEQQRSSLLENRAIQQANAAEIEAAQRRFAQQDAIAETLAHNQELASIAADGFKKVEAVNRELASLPAQQAQAEAEAASKFNQQVDKINQEYFAGQIKAQEEFAIESRRIATDTAKAAARAAEDLAIRLSDAADANDVVAFLKAQRDGQIEQRRNAEDAKTEEQRRVEDFIRGQEEQRKAFEERKRETLQGYEQERQKLAQNFSERRQQLEAQRLQEAQNTQQTLQNAQARYAQEQALAQQRANRDAQLAAIRLNQEQAAFNRQVQAINSQIAGIGQVDAAFISFVNNAKSQLASSKSISSSNASSYYSKTSGSSGFSKGSSSSGGNTYNLSMNTQVGDIATKSQVSQAMTETAGYIFGAIANGTGKAQR